MRSRGGCSKTHSRLRSVFCASEKRSGYWLRMAWNRKSASAWLCGESLGAVGGFCGEVCAVVWADGGSEAVAAGTISRRGSTTAVAAPSAALRVNSRREQGLSVVGMVITHQREVEGHTEATESRARGQLGRGYAADTAGKKGPPLIAPVRTAS